MLTGTSLIDPIIGLTRTLARCFMVKVGLTQPALAEASASEATGLYDLKIREAELRRAAGRR
jgi:hypothetical protein